MARFKQNFHRVFVCVSPLGAQQGVVSVASFVDLKFITNTNKPAKWPLAQLLLTALLLVLLAVRVRALVPPVGRREPVLIQLLLVVLAIRIVSPLLSPLVEALEALVLNPLLLFRYWIRDFVRGSSPTILFTTMYMMWFVSTILSG